MKILKSIALALISLLFLIVVISFFLPNNFVVQRTITINKKVDVPFDIVEDFRKWDLWSPWNELDTTMEKTYSETIGEVGSWYKWNSKDDRVGKGSITITQIIQNNKIEEDLVFGDMPKSKAVFTFESLDSFTKVTWELSGNNSEMPWYWHIPSKYMYLLTNMFLGGDFEKGLTKLKAASEAFPDKEKIAGFEVEQKILPALKLATIRSKVKTANMTSNQFGKWFAILSQALSSQQLKPAGAPMTFYHLYTPNSVDVEAAIPVETLGTDNGDIVFRETLPTNALVIKYYGDYTNVQTVYNQAYLYIKEKGLSSKSAPMEIYITDPGMEKDTAKWLTEIVFPLDEK